MVCFDWDIKLLFKILGQPVLSKATITFSTVSVEVILKFPSAAMEVIFVSFFFYGAALKDLGLF